MTSTDGGSTARASVGSITTSSLQGNSSPTSTSLAAKIVSGSVRGRSVLGFLCTGQEVSASGLVYARTHRHPAVFSRQPILRPSDVWRKVRSHQPQRHTISCESETRHSLDLDFHRLEKTRHETIFQRERGRLRKSQPHHQCR